MRVAATSQFRFFRDAADVTVRVRWYRVPLSRPVLDVPTVFGSSTWDEIKTDEPLGEINRTRQPWRGEPAPLIPAGKPGRCGTPAQWLDGLSVTDPGPVLDPNTGAPLCCGRVALIGDGGIAEGASDVEGRLAEADALQADSCTFTFQPAAEADAMAALICWHAWESLPEAEELAAAVSAGGALVVSGPEADALVAFVSPPASVAAGPEADGMDARFSASALFVAGPEADGMDATFSAIALKAAGPEADGMDAKVSPPATLAAGPEADGMDAVVTHGGGTVTPGADCDHAAAVTLPFHQSGTIAPGAQQWWSFAGVAGHTYRIQLSAVVGGAPSASLLTGPCSGLANRATCLSPFFACADFTLGFSGTVFIQVVADFFSGVNYVIDVADGAC